MRRVPHTVKLDYYSSTTGNKGEQLSQQFTTQFKNNRQAFASNIVIHQVFVTIVTATIVTIIIVRIVPPTL